ncbi:unnamed protein product [Closterium sp. Naga37s-1]|nr:unnamed protein product [Closterium sp. Naga37s-1]
MASELLRPQGDETMTQEDASQGADGVQIPKEGTLTYDGRYRRYSFYGIIFEVPVRYVPLVPIGRGAYGIVCSARDETTGEEVAIKKIGKAFNDRTDAKRTLREIVLLRNMNHPNVIAIKDIIRPPNPQSFQDVYIVYELMPTDLHEVIRSGQAMDERHYKFILFQLLRGTKYIHSANILHRDLKPPNILIDARCNIKITDFGLARTRVETTDHLTEYVVTRYYRAPELLVNNQQYSASIDVWSVALIYLELVLGHIVLKGDNYVDQLRKTCEGRESRGGRAGKGELGRESWEGRAGKGELGRESWEGRAGKGELGRESWEGRAGKGEQKGEGSSESRGVIARHFLFLCITSPPPAPTHQLIGSPSAGDASFIVNDAAPHTPALRAAGLPLPCPFVFFIPSTCPLSIHQLIGSPSAEDASSILIGSPSAEDASFIVNDAARTFLLSELQGFPARNIRDVFPKLSEPAADLVQRMLVFDPRKRITGFGPPVPDSLPHGAAHCHRGRLTTTGGGSLPQGAAHCHRGRLTATGGGSLPHGQPAPAAFPHLPPSSPIFPLPVPQPQLTRHWPTQTWRTTTRPTRAFLTTANPLNFPLFALDEALAHPYLAHYHKANQDPPHPSPFQYDLSFEQEEYDIPRIRQLIFEQACAFNPR